MYSIDINYKYQPLFSDTDSTYFIITGGRGSAKSFSTSLFSVYLTLSEENQRILFTRYTMVSAYISIIPEFTDKIDRLGYDTLFSVSKTDIVNTKNGNDIMFRGIKTSSGNQTAKLKSIPGLTTWILDEAEELVDESVFDTIDYSIREKGTKNRIIIVLNPAFKTHFLYKRFFEDAGVEPCFNGVKNGIRYIHTTYLDNLKNLSQKFIDNAEQLKKTNPAKYNHLFLGDWIDECEGALWKMNTMIAPFRVKKFLGEYKRIVVAVDPSVSSTGDQDECGIIVCGLGVDNHYYVIEDYSGLLSPSEWGRAAVAAYKTHECDNIIAESNQGGDLVSMNIKNSDKSVPVKLVRATRGKMVRAEPIASLYEQGLVHHVGTFTRLETEMTTYTGDEQSPNRLDALVWALTELSQNVFAIGIRSL